MGNPRDYMVEIDYFDLDEKGAKFTEVAMREGWTQLDAARAALLMAYKNLAECCDDPMALDVPDDATVRDINDRVEGIFDTHGSQGFLGVIMSVLTALSPKNR